MSKLLTGSINLSKIDKSRLYKSEKGEMFLNVSVWINDELDNYGNIASIQQQVKKDELKIYIGNLKEYHKQEPKATEQSAQNQPEPDDLPF